MTDQLYSDYIIRNNELSGVKPDQTVLFKKNLIPFLPGVKKEIKDLFKSSTVTIADSEEWYPAANSYYPFTEDVDAFARVHHLLESKNSSESVVKEAAQLINEYGDKRARHQYLRSKPTCFLVLGKPGLGEEEVARRLANHWKCVYIDPLTLLEGEIARDSRPGQCIEFNLRCGRAVGIDVLIRLLARRVQFPDVLHRGFVCCGFPLIPNDLYEEDPISSESAVFNVREIFEDMIDQTLQITDISMKVAVSMVDSSKVDSEMIKEEKSEDNEVLSQPEIEMSLEWSIQDQVCGPSDISTDLEKQLSCLFGLFEYPFVIIYLFGRNSDVISKRDNYYFDVYSNKTIDMQKIKVFYEAGAANEELTEDLFGEGRNPFADNPSLRHIVKHPENLPAHVSTQLDRYHNELVNSLDSRILQHEHQYYIKLDSRCFISQMLNLIKLRLKNLPLQPVLIPQEFPASTEEVGEGGTQEIPIQTPEEAFLKLRKQDIVSPMFQWVWSDWGSFCPVSMSESVYQKGSPKYAVHFANQIYFMSSEKNYYKFIENPRKFLLPPFPKPGSNVLVIGPPVSGKSAIAKCLGYLLNSKVLAPGEMYKEYISQALVELQEQVKQSAIAEAMEILKENQITKFEEIQQQIAEWKDEVVQNLQKLSILLDQQSKKTEDVLSSFPMMMQQSLPNIDTLDEEASIIIETLISLNFHKQIDKEFCDRLLQDPDILNEYLPDELKQEKYPETPSVHDPFVLEYVEEKVSEIQIEDVKIKAKENVYDMYARGIQAIDDAEYYGWIIDGMSLDVGVIQQLYEEFPIHEVLILTTSDYKFLVDRFKEANKHIMQYRDFRNFFLRIGERDAAYRAPSVQSTDTFRKEMAGDIVSAMLGACFDEDVLDNERILSTLKYEEALKMYEKEIQEVREGLNELQVNPIVIDITNLSVEELLEEVFYVVLDRYRRAASEFTDADRAEELQQFMTETIPTAEGEGGGGDQISDDIIAKNRRYGDTYYYCPVTFAKKFVLQRGKEEFAAKFKDKVYLCANESSMKDFIRFPRKYLVQICPPERYPPPRICVIGPNSDLREIVSRKLAKNLGVRYLDFNKIKMEAISMFSYTSLLVDPDSEDLSDTLIFHWYDILLGTIWFEEPYKYAGFVLNGFPVKPRCLNYMIFLNTIPDVIIHVALPREENLKRELAKNMNEWRLDAETQRKEDELINSMILHEWETKRNARYNELMEIKRQNRYSKKMTEERIEAPPLEDETETNAFASDTQISVDSVIEQQEHDETMRILDEEFPEPVFEESQEAEELAIEKYTAEIEGKYEKFMQHYEELKNISESEVIPFVEIDGTLELEKVIRYAYIAGNELKFRENAIFERCYDVPLDTAEKLLASGYYFRSFFGRLCPVQYYEGHNPLHMSIGNEQNNNVFPLIHRQYIYFLQGKKQRAQFIKDPLKYTSVSDFNFPLIPLRVAVIGPPKSGKTTLANRFKRDLGFHLVSRGQAIRHTLSNPLCTNLINKIEKVLRKGETLPDEIVMDCVHVASFCGECVTHGLIFDGFPNSIKEMELLSRLGMVPHLIFDLHITNKQLSKQVAEPNTKYPQFSKRFVQHIYSNWSKSQAFFREWCDREYQNIYKIKVDRSIWGVWSQAKEVTLSVIFERKHYFKHFNLDWPLRLANMLVTPLEFLERQSQYKTYCPVCFFYTHKLMNGGDPPDRTGLVQYGKKFYWLCEEHIDIFLRTPEQFIPPSNALLPLELPKHVVCTEVPENPVENGFCLVCYQNHFPKKVLLQGTQDFVVSYKDRYYMFDKPNCVHDFMTQPEDFSHLIIHYKDDDIPADALEYRSLPILGMLEQYLSKNIVQAVNSANVNRPIIPGLSIAQSALIFVGLNLKINNPNTRKMKQYQKAMQHFNERASNLQKYLEIMKTYVNPIVYYEEPDTPSSTEVEVDSDEEQFS